MRRGQISPPQVFGVKRHVEGFFGQVRFDVLLLVFDELVRVRVDILE